MPKQRGRPAVRHDVTKRTLNQVKRYVPIVLAIALLAYVLRAMPLVTLWAQVRQAAPGWVALAVVAVVLQTVVRAWRWQMLLRSLGHRPPLHRCLVAMLAGSAAGLVVPGTGEVLRCSALLRTDNVPLTQSVGSVVAERLLDLALLAGLLLLALPVGAGRFITWLRLYGNSLQPPGATFWLGGLLLILILLATAYWQRETLRSVSQKFRLAERGRGLWAGLSSAGRVRPRGPFWLANVLIYALSFLILWGLLLALPATATLPPSSALVLLAVTSLGSLTIPTQANLGSYHFLASRVLLTYGLTLPEGVAWATVSHALITLVNVALSGLGFALAGRVLGDKR